MADNRVGHHQENQDELRRIRADRGGPVADGHDREHERHAVSSVEERRGQIVRDRNGFEPWRDLQNGVGGQELCTCVAGASDECRWVVAAGFFSWVSSESLKDGRRCMLWEKKLRLWVVHDRLRLEVSTLNMHTTLRESVVNERPRFASGQNGQPPP